MKKILLKFLVVLTLTAILAQAQSAGDNFLQPYRPEFVHLQAGKLEPFNSDQFIKAPYFILFYCAGWCPDCRRFTPELVKAYAQQNPADKSYEVLLLPMDRSEEGMVENMQIQQMKWPAVAYAKFGPTHPLRKLFSAKGIPCLTVVDAKGTILFQSKSDQDAPEVLKQLQQLVRKEK